MLRPNIRNRSFDRMGEKYSHLIDPYHFLGRSSFDIPWPEEKVPSVNIHRNGADFVLELAVPGFAKDDIEIIVKEDVLTIRGEKSRSEERSKDREYILEEFNTEAFERSFKLAQRIMHDQITAHYENGVLTLTFANVAAPERTQQTVEIT